MNNSRFKPESRAAAAAAAGHRRSIPSFSLRAKPVARSAESVDYEQFFVSQLSLLEKVVAQVCRRHHLPEPEMEEFASDVRCHVIARDYEVLRRFRGRSSIHTYLTVVVVRQFLNYRNRLWGRWRPSAEATRLGAVAVLLERLIGRDQWSFEEAQELMRTNHGVQESRDELYALWIRLSPALSVRVFIPEGSAENVASGDPGPVENIVRAERDFIVHHVKVALDRARQELAAEEQLLLKMRFDDGFTVSQIARELHRRQKPLYRTFERVFARLKERLLAAGISAGDIRVVFADIEGTPGGNRG